VDRTGSRTAWALLAIVGLAFAATSCGEDLTPAQETTVPATTVVPVTTSPGTTAPATTAPATIAPVGADQLARIWFLDGDRLAPVYRVVPGPESAIQALLSGPDSGTSLGTAIPAGSALRSYQRDGTTAVVDIDGTFASGGGTFSMQARLGQLVATALDWPDTTSVTLLLDGTPVDVFSSEGIVLEQPLTADDTIPVRAFIVVDEPRPGALVTSPLTVRGAASAFESTVSLEVRDEDGRLLFEGFTTATGAAFDDEGNPAWAPFSATVTFAPGTATAGVVTAYESSAKDGTPINVMAVPVRFTEDGRFLTTLGPSLLPQLPGTG
jgi:germination protein M